MNFFLATSADIATNKENEEKNAEIKKTFYKRKNNLIKLVRLQR